MNTSRKAAVIVAAAALAISMGVTLADAAPAAPATAATQPGEPALKRGPQNIIDVFDRSLTGALGAAYMGGQWSAAPAAAVSTDGKQALLALQPGKQVETWLPGISTTDQSLRATIRLSQLPVGGDLQFYLFPRWRGGGNSMGARLVVRADGTMYAEAVRLAPGSLKVIGARATVTGLMTPNQAWVFEVESAGTSSYSIKARAWLQTQTLPGWQVQATDTGNTTFATADAVGMLALNTGTAPVGLGVTKYAGWPLVANVASPYPAIPAGARYVNPATTGVPKGTVLTVRYGNLWIDKDGTVIENLDLHGIIHVRAKNVIIRNSVIRGEDNTIPSQCVIEAKDPSVVNLVVSHVEIDPEYPNVFSNAVGVCGNDFTLTGSNIHGTTDGVGAYRGRITVRDTWIHDLAWFERDPDQTNGSHSDAIQITGESDYVFERNYLSGDNPMTNSSLMIGSGFSRVGTVSVKDNFLDYGASAVIIDPKDKPTLGPVVITGNVIGSHHRNADYNTKYFASVNPGVNKQGVTLTYKDNKFASTGQEALVWFNK